MAELKIENGIIRSTMLGYEGHGILTALIDIRGDGWGCGFGLYEFDSYCKASDSRKGSPYCAEFIAGVLKTVGVDKWEQLKGKHVRVETQGWGGRILRIGNIIDNKWFDPQELSERMRTEVPNGN